MEYGSKILKEQCYFGILVISYALYEQITNLQAVTPMSLQVNKKKKITEKNVIRMFVRSNWQFFVFTP